MPPPTAGDDWLSGRRFGVVIDAGSSGSRLQIYSWRDARVVRAEDGPDAFKSLPKVEKGSRDADGWVRKVEPGISTFGTNPEGVPAHLAPLLEHARANIPPSLHSQTPIFLYATAGMRLLPDHQRSDVIDAACSFLKFHSNFHVDPVSDAGPCGSSIRVISGEEEGLFGWIAVNYLMDQFTEHNTKRTTYGFLDMGGASTQIAFEPSPAERKPTDSLTEVRLRLIGGEEIRHDVFVTTWLGYGTNQARERYVDETARRHETVDPIPDPCLPRGLVLTETLDAENGGHGRSERSVVGTGSFEQCLTEVAPLLNKKAPCPDVPCLFNGVHVPKIDFSVSHFIGVSEYWYSSEHVFGLGGAYNFAEFERAASDFCSRSWEDIQRQHQLSQQNNALGGDGEVEVDGVIVDVGKWGENVELSRLQMQCFKSAWLVNVLHEGIGMPRIVDPGGNPAGDATDVELRAGEKGLGMPLMQSLDSINDTAISWTLGKMVLVASREVPPLTSNAPDISDPTPIVGNGSGIHEHATDKWEFEGSPLKDIPFATVPALELTLSNMLLALVWLLVFVTVAYRLRRPVSNLGRMFMRSVRKAEIDNEGLEDGTLGSSHAQSSRVWTILSTLQFPLLSPNTRSYLSRFTRMFKISSQSTQPSSSLFPPRHMPSMYPRASQQRSFSSPAPRSQNGSARISQITTAPGGSWTPQGSHSQLSAQDVQANGHATPLYQLPRSRNNSQMNLTMLVPRQSISRNGSGQQTPTGSFDDGD